MNYSFKTKGVCSTKIDFEIDDNGILHNVVYTGGCNGNLKAIGKLVEGKNADEIAAVLEGNTCGFNSTSCADQLSKAIRKAQENK